MTRSSTRTGTHGPTCGPVERFFGRIKHFRRVATRYEKTARNYLAMLHLVSAMVWLL